MKSIIILGAALTVLGTFMMVGNWPLDAGRQMLGQPSHDKLGWMDDAEYTKAMQDRVAKLGGQTYSDDRSWISAMQSGARSGITRDDFELFRQDRRRAMAAYPDIPQDKLIAGAWITIDESAGIPMDFGGSNSNGTKVGDKWVLDGGTYVGFVRNEYPNRASATDTKAFFVAKREKSRQDEIARLKKDGPYLVMGGTGGSLSISLDKKTNMVVVEQSDNYAPVGKKYLIPFIAEEWVGVWTIDQIKNIPSFQQATIIDVKIKPNGPTISYSGPSGVGMSGKTSGFIMPGETVTVEIPLPLATK